MHSLPFSCLCTEIHIIMLYSNPWTYFRGSEPCPGMEQQNKNKNSTKWKVSRYDSLKCTVKINTLTEPFHFVCLSVLFPYVREGQTGRLLSSSLKLSPSYSPTWYAIIRMVNIDKNANLQKKLFLCNRNQDIKCITRLQCPIKWPIKDLSPLINAFINLFANLQFFCQ